MKDLTISKEEKAALRYYRGSNYESINQLLVCNVDTDLDMIAGGVENKSVSLSFDKDSVIRNLDTIKTIYEIMMKVYYTNNRKEGWAFTRGTNLAEIDRLKNEVYIDKFLSSTTNEEKAKRDFSAVWNKPALMYVCGDSSIPFISVKEVLKDSNFSDEVIIAPFTIIKNIQDAGEVSIPGTSKTIKTYNITLEKQNLQQLSEEDREGLYNYIIDSADSINYKLRRCLELEKENLDNYENIRKLEQLLSRYDSIIEEKEESKDYSESERKADLDDINRINKELDELKSIATDVFEDRKDIIEFITDWKKNIAVYMMAVCREIEIEYQAAYEVKEKYKNLPDAEEDEEEKVEENKEEVAEENPEAAEVVEEKEETEEVKPEEVEEEPTKEELEEKFEEAKEKVEEEKAARPSYKTEIEDISENDIKVNKVEFNNSVKFDDEISKMATQVVEKIEEGTVVNEEPNKEKVKTVEDYKAEFEKEIIEDEEAEFQKSFDEAKAIVEENIVLADKLVDDIEALIAKQQNHAKVAENLGATYKSLNNAFDMKRAALHLCEMNREIKLKIMAIAELNDKKEAINKLKTSTSINTQINTLINYLNNPQIATRNEKIKRFDEIAIIEENELKRGILERVRDIMGEAELKKLKDDAEEIESRPPYQKLVGLLTGRNKLDEFVLEQIDIRQKAIRRSLSLKLSLVKNYSIHEIIALIRMFIEDNFDDELVEDEVVTLESFENELKRNFIVSDSKVMEIVNEREGRNLPLDGKKRLTKRDQIEIDTYRFLNKYGYDVLNDDSENEPEYQDTIGREINRITDYIDSSMIMSF